MYLIVTDSAPNEMHRASAAFAARPSRRSESSHPPLPGVPHQMVSS